MRLLVPAIALALAACGEKQPPPAPAAPLAITPMPVAASAAASVSPAQEHDAVTLLVNVYERSLNEGDAATAETSSTKECWAKECGSLSSQAKRKFKVKSKDDAEVRGTHARATMDVLCDGGARPCDRVYLLVVKDCAPNAPQTWMVADVTEDEKKRAAWLDSAPEPCR
ncbi:MAG: hypothetical protein KIT84_13865 [Labilithrix sp.]|nr:hypothetical protein [Labilithrix sp.]MCW5812106.1 hypothetical protein [Labilithrix sp.]